jgi:hypothetical protein
LRAFDVDVSDLSGAKEAFMVQFLKDSARSLVHLTKTKSIEPIRGALETQLHAEGDGALGGARDVEKKLSMFSF